jgi:para-nitrobenzyl esterase
MRSDYTTLLNRRKFIVDSSIGFAFAAGTSLLCSSRLAWAQSSATETVEAKTAYGRLRGKLTGDVITFKGVPYAGSISGENRFKAPKSRDNETFFAFHSPPA